MEGILRCIPGLALECNWDEDGITRNATRRAIVETSTPLVSDA